MLHPTELTSRLANVTTSFYKRVKYKQYMAGWYAELVMTIPMYGITRPTKARST